MQLLLDRERAAANLHASSEDDWEDIDEEPVEDPRDKDWGPRDC